MGTHSSHERQALADALTTAGPDAPTLCAGWSALDLAVHVLIRERRPDAVLGTAIPFLAAHTARVAGDVRARPFEELIAEIRSGPPRLSPLAIPAIEEKANLTELFVHTEDVRRGEPGWSARSLEPELSEALWSHLAFLARFTLRRATVPVRLVRPDGAEIATGKAGVPVRLHGEPGELMLYVTGRTGAATVELTGPEHALAMFRETPLGL